MAEYGKRKECAIPVFGITHPIVHKFRRQRFTFRADVKTDKAAASYDFRSPFAVLMAV